MEAQGRDRGTRPERTPLAKGRASGVTRWVPGRGSPGSFPCGNTGRGGLSEKEVDTGLTRGFGIDSRLRSGCEALNALLTQVPFVPTATGHHGDFKGSHALDTVSKNVGLIVHLSDSGSLILSPFGTLPGPG